MVQLGRTRSFIMEYGFDIKVLINWGVKLASEISVGR